MMAFCPEHSKWDQNPKFTPLRETTSILTPFICRVSSPPPRACDVFHCVLVSPCLISGFKAGHFYLAVGSWTSRNINAVFSPKFKFTANFSAPAQDGKPLFPLWEITRHFAQSARRGEEKIQLPTLLGVVICARVGSLVGGVFPVWSII